MLLPDYEHSIVNLMASLATAIGAGETGYAPLANLPAGRLQQRPVVLLVADGLGAELLARHADSRLASGWTDTLTSVFPTTTATAITSFATGVAPQQHAVTGWFTWLAELGSVAAVLPFVPRGGGQSYLEAGVRPEQIVGARALTERTTARCSVVTPAYIAESAYSRFTGGPAERYGHRGLGHFFDTLATLVLQGGSSYTFAYWAELDSLAHQYGVESPQVSGHFAVFDQAYAEFLDRIVGSGAIVLVTADHGLIDSSEAHTLRLEDHPSLAETLVLPLCGEPRAAFCYVRNGRAAEFEAYVRDRLADAVELFRSADLIEAGWFGRGRPDPRLRQRVGDYALIMRDNWIIRDRLLTERPFRHVGVHGGTSAAEMQVPLVVAEP